MGSSTELHKGPPSRKAIGNARSHLHRGAGASTRCLLRAALAAIDVPLFGVPAMNGAEAWVCRLAWPQHSARTIYQVAEEVDFTGTDTVFEL